MKKTLTLICCLAVVATACTSNESRTGETYDSTNMVTPGNSSQNDSLNMMNDTSSSYSDTSNRMGTDTSMLNN